MSLDRIGMVILAALFFLMGLAASISDDRVVAAEEVLATIRAGEPMEFDNCIIVGNLNLSSLDIKGPVHFNHSIFQNKANFAYAAFNDDTYFLGSGFNGTADFEGSSFNGTANFGVSDFNGYADFVSSNFNDYANFWLSDFNGYANFEGSTFNGTANFGVSDFNGTAIFVSSSFYDYANFNSSDFNGIANFGLSNFNGYADFRLSDFNGYADFRYSDFNDHADFELSDFNDYALFYSSNFNDIANFCGSNFNGTVHFVFSTFNKEATFNDVMFKGNAKFDSTQFERDTLFENTTFLGKLSLTRTKYNKLFIRWYNIKGGLVYDDAAYISLMKNFKDLGYYEDYDSCYYAYRKAHRSQEDWPSVPDWEEAIRKFIDRPLEWFYGYGTKPFYAFFWSLGIVIAFFFYWRWLGLGGPKDKTKESLKDSEEWLDGDLTDILGYSVTVFLSGTKFFIDPPALPRIEGHSRYWIKKAFILERALGMLFLVLFFIAISGTIVRAS